MKKVAFTCNRLGAGGAERVITNLSNCLAKDGIKVYIICLDILSGFYYHIEHGVEIIQLDENQSDHKSWLSRKTNGLVNLYRLFSVFKKIRPDVVVSFYSKQNCYSILCSRLLRIPVICSERDHFFLTDSKANHIFRKMFYKHANGFIHQTQWAKEYLEWTYSTPVDSIVLQNPIWLSDFPERKPVDGSLIAVGRLAKQKNYIGMIKAFSKVHDYYPHATLSIYGEGSQRGELQQLINQLKMADNVFLKGQTNNVSECYAKADIFVMFSFGEGYPNALLEALACGVPAISSNCPIGGPASMIRQGENGVLVETDNEDELSQKLIELLGNPELKLHLSDAAREIRKQNSMNVIYSKFYGYIEHIVELKVEKNS